MWPVHPGERIQLPPPEPLTGRSLYDCLKSRRSVREYSAEPVTVTELSRLLWAAQGVTGIGGLRTAPSAGAFYPLNLHVSAARIRGLNAGLYRYQPDTHELSMVEKGTRHKRLMQAALGQECVGMAPLAVLITCWEKRIRAEFGDAAPKLALIEAGHVGQNFLLEATALGLGAVGLSKYDPDALRAVWPFPDSEYPVYLLLAGRPSAG